MSHRLDAKRMPWCVTSLLAVAWLCAVPAIVSGAEIRAGVASVDITPPIGGVTAGYSSAEPTDGVHDPISARVLVLESKQSTIALAVCDLCTFNSSWLHEQMPSIGVDRLLFMNTHTHAGPRLQEEDFPIPETSWRETVE